MKKAITLLTCVSLFYACCAQESPRTKIEPGSPAAAYFQKAKSQKKTAIVLVSTGGLLVVVGTVVAAQSLDFNLDFSNSYGTSSSSSNSDETVAGVLILGGLAAILTSIGFFVASHKNKKKALSLSWKNEQVLLFPQGMKYNNQMPAWNLRFNF